MPESGRDISLDITKGVAIFLVVLGHCIQYDAGRVNAGTSLWNEPVFQFIYSFHMPLFMLLSGYLFSRTAKRDAPWGVIRSKMLHLLLPVATWGCFYQLLRVVFWAWDWSWSFFFYHLWFLWAVFLCSCIVLLVRHWFRDSIVVYVVIGALMLFLPDHNCFPYVEYMYPYYVLGYRIGGSGLRRGWKSMYCFGAALVLFAVMFHYYGVEDFVYTSKTSLLVGGYVSLSQLKVDLFRYAIGLVGAYVVWRTIDLVYSSWRDGRIWRVFVPLGRETMGIYIVHLQVVEFLSPLPFVGQSYVRIFAFSYALTRLLRCWRVTALLCLGSRK